MLPRVSVEYIDKAEERLSVKFAAPYRHFMSVKNGGFVHAMGDEWELYPIRDESSVKRISRTSNDVVAETKSAREMSWFPSDAVAIGSCNMDKLVLLPSDAGTHGDEGVFVWVMRGGELIRVFESVDDMFAVRR